MNLHANAALSLNQRRRMVGRVIERTCSKWVGRYRADGETGLRDRSSAPRSIPHRTAADRVEVIACLRRLRMTGAEIAECSGLAPSTSRRSSRVSGWAGSHAWIPAVRRKHGSPPDGQPVARSDSQRSLVEDEDGSGSPP